MYQSETGGITEQELTSILKSAMGVSDLNVSNLFKAIDDKEKGEIAYGKSIFYRFLCMEIRKGIWKRNLSKQRKQCLHQSRQGNLLNIDQQQTPHSFTMKVCKQTIKFRWQQELHSWTLSYIYTLLVVSQQILRLKKGKEQTSKLLCISFFCNNCIWRLQLLICLHRLWVAYLSPGQTCK